MYSDFDRTAFCLVLGFPRAYCILTSKTATSYGECKQAVTVCMHRCGEATVASWLNKAWEQKGAGWKEQDGKADVRCGSKSTVHGHVLGATMPVPRVLIRGALWQSVGVFQALFAHSSKPTSGCPPETLSGPPPPSPRPPCTCIPCAVMTANPLQPAPGASDVFSISDAVLSDRLVFVNEVPTPC